MAIDFRACLDALSDVVINRPPPLRHFDQIYMKLPDMLLQAEHISHWFNGKDVIFIGDGDAIALALVHMHAQTDRSGRKLLLDGPKRVKVVDFDERMVKSINQFAHSHDLADIISADLYNVSDQLPIKYWQTFDAFYTNPPWGASNDGVSVCAFIQRGIEAVRGNALGCVVIGDHAEFQWTHNVLLNTQKYLIEHDFRVAEMLPAFHHYHLDDSPELTSCSLLVKRIGSMALQYASDPLSAVKLENFYGAGNPLKYHYVRDLSNGGKLATRDVELIPFGEK